MTMTLSNNTDDEAQQRRKELSMDNLEVGILLASKAILEMITNPFVGMLTDKLVTHSRITKLSCEKLK